MKNIPYQKYSEWGQYFLRRQLEEEANFRIKMAEAEERFRQHIINIKAK